MKLPNITKVKSLKGKRVLLRLDLNVPTVKGEVVDDFRIRKVLPTVKFLKKSGAKVIILSHTGRGKEDSLLPVSRYMAKTLKHSFVADFQSEEGKQILDGVKNGEIAMLENLRRNDGENGKSTAFAKSLAALGEVYVNEAFAVSHRKDASIYLLPKYLPSYFGPLFCDEVENLSFATKKHSPFLFVLGGAKFETKMPLIKKYLTVADTVFVGGALANNFFKVLGYEIGRSLVDGAHLNLKPILKNKKLLLPLDVVVDCPTGRCVKTPQEVLPGEAILDSGPKTVAMLAERVKAAKFVLWNGPLGNYEAGYGEATLALAQSVLGSKAKAVVGGGDTVAAIAECKMKKSNTFISTGGGAMLEFLAQGTLPGIEAQMKKKSNGMFIGN
ncbi:MAG: phosphoglycerate kinase [Parcubacteria group bacterium]|nr:phosphoglycerate kinase [Parcubacteria group bacterium]